MKKASILMILGPLFLLGLYVFPLWNIMLGAPQYPDPLGLNIHISGLKGVNEFDIQNIDGLNHYIGMHTLPKVEDMWEFGTFPMVIAVMVALGVVIGVLGYWNKVSYKWFLGWFLLMSVMGILGMYDFNAWLVDYGTDLDPNAIMKLTNPDGSPMTYKPPLLGHVKMLNFDVTSLPAFGAWLMFVGMMLTLVAGILGWKSTKNNNLTPMKKQIIPLLVFLGLVLGCSVSPQPIDYGHVGCHYCSMTIVDKQHAAQLVTSKGKIFNFDAVECMMNSLKSGNVSDISLFLVNDFDHPGELVDATKATYLISEKIPSPMGAFLSAFSEHQTAQQVLAINDGVLLSWNDLKQQYEQ